jgi:hypothetical protein
VACHAGSLAERAVRRMTRAGRRSKLVRLMEGLRKIPRVLIQTALVVVVLALPAAPALTCDGGESARGAHGMRVAGEGKQPENRGTRDKDKCKRANGSRTVPKGCPDGGERLPNDNNKRSPIDDAPPLTPLVA